VWTEGQGRNTRWCAALMKLTFLVVAGLVAPLVSVASPVISGDSGYYGRYDEGRDAYGVGQYVDPAGARGYGDYGYDRRFGSRRAEGRGEPRQGRRPMPWEGTSDPYDDRIGDVGGRPYAPRPDDWAPSGYPSPKWGGDDAPPPPDRFGEPYQHRSPDSPGSLPYAYGQSPDRGWDRYRYPRYRSDGGDGLKAGSRPSYRFRGAPAELELPAGWWGGYRFRPLTDADVRRMRSGADEVRAPYGWPGGLAEPPGRGGSEGPYGYQPDGRLGR